MDFSWRTGNGEIPIVLAIYDAKLEASKITEGEE
jgi:hypothetical protein